MRVSANLTLCLALGVLLPGAASAAELRSCLTPDERREVLAAHKAVPLAQAMHVVKAKLRGEVLKARLCRYPRGLVYVLTVLAQDGKVTQARVDAADGRWLEGSGG